MATPIAPPAAPYAPPATIRVQPPTFLIDDTQVAFRQLVIVLDVEDGILSAENWQQGRDFHDRHLPAYYPHRDLYFVGTGHDWWTRSARRLGWSPHHYPAFPATQAGFVEVLELMGRWAKELVDALEPLPDGGWDWTLRATAAYDRIGYLTSYGTEGLLGDKTDPWHGNGTAPLPDRHPYGAVSFDEVLAAAPAGWADPLWSTLSDAELDLVAESLTNRWRSEVPAHLRKPVPHAVERQLHATVHFHRRRQPDRPLGEENQGLPIHVVGARAGLRRWRANFIADARQLPAEHASTFLHGHPEAFPAALVAASSDREVDHLAEVLDAEAAQQHRLALVSTPGVLREHRAQLRADARVQLGVLGDAYARMAAELRQLGDRRAALLHEVASYQEEPEWDAEAGEPRYAELARVARMTRQAVRERLTVGDPDTEARRRGLAVDEARVAIIARIGPDGSTLSEIDRWVGRQLLEPLRPVLEDMVAAGILTRDPGEVGNGDNPRYRLAPAPDDEALATAIVEYLIAAGRPMPSGAIGLNLRDRGFGDVKTPRLTAQLNAMIRDGRLLIHGGAITKFAPGDHPFGPRPVGDR